MVKKDYNFIKNLKMQSFPMLISKNSPSKPSDNPPLFADLLLLEKRLITTLLATHKK